MEDVTKANRSHDKIYPDLVTRYFRLFESMRDHFKPIFIVEGYRSHARQKWLYDKKIKVTNAEPGQSWHQFGLALDLAFLDKNPYADTHPWADLRRLAIGCGFGVLSKFDSKGMLVGDRPHVELRYGFTLGEIQSLYAYNGLEAVWCAIDKKRGVPIGDKWLVGPPPKV